ncbi:MAG: zinc ribbon domain-containing protein [Clostridia bacterium]|nr:zinc ribbon domain-containing protein [Clostridia bacterium]
MGFLERAIRKGISDGIGKAVGNAINQAIEPKATQLVNKATEQLNSAAGNSNNSTANSTMGSTFSELENAARNFATQQAGKLKICPSCGDAATAEQKFCPGCGGALPEQTVSQSAQCTACGKQNNIGVRFCTDCGAKLPYAIAQDEQNVRKTAAVLNEWSEKLPQYPLWSFGGESLCIDEYDGYFSFSADFSGNRAAAQNAVAQYKALAKQHGFREAGQYPSDEHLYKMSDEICYHIDFEHCYEAGADCVSLAFLTGEPSGGFNYVKPEPKKPIGLKDIFKF